MPMSMGWALDRLGGAGQWLVVAGAEGGDRLPVRLMYGFNAGALASVGPGVEGSSVGPLRLRRQITLPDGRRLEYVEQGVRSGEVVLLFHN